MNHWQILEIEPVTDTRLVRRAYAKVLKTIDQDLEPERFIALREALQRAQAEIEYGLDDDAEDAERSDEAVDNEADPCVDVPAEAAQSVAVESLPHDTSADQISEVELLSSEGEESSAFLRYQAVLQAMHRRDYSDVVYQQFVQVLANLPHQHLGAQLAAYDQLTYALARGNQPQEEGEALIPEQFLRYWQQVRGNERPLASAQYAFHALHDRIEQMEREDQFWQQVPQHLSAEMRILRTEPRLRYLAMVRLAWSKAPFIRAYLQQNWRVYPIAQMDKSLNVSLVGYLQTLGQTWPTLFMIFFALYTIFGVLFPDVVAVLTPGVEHLDPPDFNPWIILTGSAIGSAVLWTVSAQAILCAWVAKVEAVRQIADRVAVSWFAAALVLVVGLPYLSTQVQDVLLGVWLLMGAVVTGYSRFNSQSLFYYLFQLKRSTPDYAWVTVGTLLLFYGVKLCVTTWGSDAGISTSVFLAFAPVVLFWHVNYFRQALTPKRRLRLLAGGIGLLVIGGMLPFISGIDSELGVARVLMNKLQLAAFLLVLSLVVWIPEQKLAYLLKYGVYLAVLISPLFDSALVIFSSASAYMLVRAVWHDFVHWRSLSKQQAIST